MYNKLMEEETYTVSQACEILGAPKYTIRRIIRNGLVRGVKRQRNYYQALSKGQLDSLRIFYYLNRSGVGLRDLKKYASLEANDQAADQKAFLETKKRQFWEELKDMQDTIDLIERKIECLEKSPKA